MTKPQDTATTSAGEMTSESPTEATTAANAPSAVASRGRSLLSLTWRP